MQLELVEYYFTCMQTLCVTFLVYYWIHDSHDYITWGLPTFGTLGEGKKLEIVILVASKSNVVVDAHSNMQQI